jgi:prepilin signal peptidase PulO-like enzyme (type II secretory pathway)
LIPEPALSCLRCALFLCCAAPITVVDIKSARIPDLFSLGGLACLVLFDALLEPPSLLGDSLAAAFAFGLFYAVRVCTRGLGFGDLKYAALVAFYSGIPYCFAAMAAAALAALVFFAVAFAFRGKRRSIAVPFAPFLTVGALVAAAMELVAGGGGGS